MKRKLACLFTIVALICMIAVPAYAAQSQLEAVVVNVNGTLVEVGLVDYATAIALSTSNPLYNYLRGSGAAPIVENVKGGGKYISLVEYATNYALSGKITSAAIDNSVALPSEQVSIIKVFNGFDENGQAVLLPIGGGDEDFCVISIE